MTGDRRFAGWRGPLIAGLLLGGSYYLPLLVPNLIGLLPLLRWLDDPESRGTWRRLRGGFLFGVVAHSITLYFIGALLRFSWLAVLLYVGMVFGFALRIALTVWLAGWIRDRTRLAWALVLPLTWIPLEWLQGLGDLRMTADHLAHTVATYPFLIQFADIVGHYGVTAFVLAVNGLLYGAFLETGRSRRRRSAAAFALLALTVLAYDAWAWTRPTPDGRTLRVAVVQPDIPLLVKRDETTVQQQWDRLVDLTRQAAAAGAELIVWPETAYPKPIHHWLDHPRTFHAPDLQQLALEVGTPLLVGVEYYRIRDREDYERYNAAVVVDAQGRLSPRWAAKQYLVPFAEAVPFSRWLGPMVEGRGGEWRFVSGGFTAGDGDSRVATGTEQSGVLVCYEQLFPERARRLREAGADYLAVLTNDAWFGRTAFQDYQADVLRLRAIENRTPLVRAANSGISGFVDRRGRYSGRTELFEPTVSIGEIRLTDETTWYRRAGDLVLWVVSIGLIAALCAAYLRPAPVR